MRLPSQKQVSRITESENPNPATPCWEGRRWEWDRYKLQVGNVEEKKQPPKHPLRFSVWYSPMSFWKLHWHAVWMGTAFPECSGWHCRMQLFRCIFIISASSFPGHCPRMALVELDALQIVCSAAENTDPKCIWPWKGVALCDNSSNMVFFKTYTQSASLLWKNITMFTLCYIMCSICIPFEEYTLC